RGAAAGVLIGCAVVLLLGGEWVRGRSERLRTAQ
ncbi:ABC transporter permease, partial [Pseudomonas syringae]